MRFILIAGLVALFCFQSTYAHTYLSSVYLDDKLLEEGDCVRPHPSTAYDSPIPLVTSPDMTCGWLPQANQPTNRKCPVAAGATIGIQWHHQSNSPSDDILDPTHVGPTIVYLAKSDSGSGNVWFKIYEDGFSGGKWGVDRLLAKRGRLDITIPSDIAPGNYLLRGEILALHGAYDLNGVQPYVGCVELTISGSGTANPTGVAFPGYYKNTDPGMLFNRYQGFTSYPIPGPALYQGSSSTPGTPTTAPTSRPPTAPTTAPTTRPTTAPTTRPTTAPSSGNIQLSLNSGSSEWWVGVIVSGGGETTVKVEMTDSDSIKTWTALADQSYAYVYEPAKKIKAPISLRLTSSSGKQVVLQNVFTSFSSGNINTGKTYASGGSPTSAPAPTTPPRPTVAPNPSSSTKVTVYATSTVWWFAVTVSGGASKVEVKDSGRVTSFTNMTPNTWGDSVVYTYSPQGYELVTPISVRVTDSAGKTSVATITSIAANASYDAQ